MRGAALAYCGSRRLLLPSPFIHAYLLSLSAFVLPEMSAARCLAEKRLSCRQAPPTLALTLQRTAVATYRRAYRCCTLQRCFFAAVPAATCALLPRRRGLTLCRLLYDAPANAALPTHTALPWRFCGERAAELPYLYCRNRQGFYHYYGHVVFPSHAFLQYLMPLLCSFCLTAAVLYLRNGRVYAFSFYPAGGEGRLSAMRRGSLSA